MLTDSRIKREKPRKKTFKLYDERGLYLIVNTNGSRWWRFKYRFGGNDKTISMGVYPDVGLAAARKKRDKARKLLAEDGIDPSAQRKAEKVAQIVASAGTFKAVAEEWLDAGCPGSGRTKGRPSSDTIRQLRGRLTKHVYPWIGSKPMSDITLADLRGVLTRIGRRGQHKMAHRVRSICERVYRYAIATERAERNIAADLKGTLVPTESKGFPAITEAKPFGELLKAIDCYEGQPTTMAALKLAPLVFVRPFELRAAEWAEFDLDAARWSIPDSRMKERLPHVVPLSKQALAIITELQPYSGDGKYLFPSLRSRTRSISSNTLNAALRRLGLSKEEMTTHGFRKSASTLLHEMGYSPDEIETQLAHKRPGVAGIYNKSHLLKQRTKMMQKWADYLDRLKKGSSEK